MDLKLLIERNKVQLSFVATYLAKLADVFVPLSPFRRGLQSTERALGIILMDLERTREPEIGCALSGVTLDTDNPSRPAVKR